MRLKTISALVATATLGIEIPLALAGGTGAVPIQDLTLVADRDVTASAANIEETNVSAVRRRRRLPDRGRRRGRGLFLRRLPDRGFRSESVSIGSDVPSPRIGTEG